MEEDQTVTNNRTAYQFKVTLKGIEPPIWRYIQVPSTYTFWDLHVALQDAIGWMDYHLHVFRIRATDTGEVEEIGIPNDEPFVDEVSCLPGWQTLLSKYFRQPGDSTDYEYDFGDGWEHEVVLEKIVDQVPGREYPLCLAGERACPPEDCGGIPGYEELLQTISNPFHEEYESTIEWLGGGYAPDAFDSTKVHFDDPKKRWKAAFERG